MKKLLFAIIALLIVCFFIWDSDTIQYRYFPRNYWSRQVERLEKDVKHFRHEVNRITADLLATPSVLLRLQNEAIKKGMPPDEARRYASEIVNSAIGSLNKELQGNRIALEKYRKLLERAKKQLKKYER